MGFANAEGGTVVVGLSDGFVEGTAAPGPERLSAWQQTALDFTRPAVAAATEFVECHNTAGRPDRLLIFTVEPSAQVHTDNRDRAFLRVGDENRGLTFDQRLNLAYDKGQSSYEVTPVTGAGLDDLDRPLLADYAEAVAHPDPLRLLHARNLLTGSGEVTTAAPSCSSA